MIAKFRPLIGGSRARIVFALTDVLSSDPAFARRLFKTVLAVQLLFAILALLSKVGLYADGAYFNYIIATGHPWDSFWHEMSSRLTVYAFQVWPLLQLVDHGMIRPDRLAHAQSLLFFGMPFLQYCVVYALCEKKNAELLTFPAVNFIFFALLCFGFETEMTFVPGFFWITFFAGLRFGWAHPLAIASQLLMIFCHELAVLSALALVAASMIIDRRSGRPFPWVFIGATTAGVGVLVALKVLGFSPQGNQNALSALNPVNVFENPELFITLTTITFFLVIERKLNSLIFAGLVTVAFYAIFCYSLWTSGLDFGSGRYSSRSILAFGTPALGILCSLAYCRHSDAPARLARIEDSRTKGALLIGLFATTTFTLMFFASWTMFLHRIEAFAQSGQSHPGTEIVALPAVRAMDPNLDKRISVIGYNWTLPFLSIMTARDLAPDQVVFDPNEGFWLCRRGDFRQTKSSHVPADVQATVERFACSQEAPPARDGLITRVMRRLHF